MGERVIENGSECMVLHEDGCVSRPGIGHKPSGEWKITGAVTRKPGERPVFWSLRDLLDRPDEIPWKHANGKQKTSLTDIDHGQRREWGGSHRVR